MRRGSNQKRRRTVIVFLRAPELGRVKTRLALEMAPADVLALYRCFVHDTLATVTAAGATPVLCIHPPEALETVTAEFAPGHEAFPQKGADLGQRMASAFVHVFAAGRSQALLVGTDIPHLPAGVYREALIALERHPVVIGPAADGGYYLIGFRNDSFTPTVFEGMPWGADDVFRRTCSALADHGMAPYRLASYRDMDTLSDVVAFTRDPTDEARLTRACLAGLGLTGNRETAP